MKLRQYLPDGRLVLHPPECWTRRECICGERHTLAKGPSHTTATLGDHLLRKVLKPKK